MLASLLLGLALAGPKPLDFYATGPYDTAVPRPETVLGYPIGSRITTYRDQERVVTGIAERARARVRGFEYGKSTQGRPLRVFAISSPENIARLDQIRADLAALAAGDASAERIARTPAVVWINECIHGNEPASFESAMPLLYNLAASRHTSIADSLKNAIVILNPVYNPDGHERYAVWYNSVAVGSAEPGAYEQRELGALWGRYNQYRFDMNRDRVAFSQDETRQEVAEFLRWNPQVYVDQHGQVDTYFFPPNPMAVNANVDRDRLNKWTEVFGRATGRAFDEKGYLYYIRDQFDLYYPGYLDSFTSLSGAIGMTHETDGGKQLAKLRNDGTVLTFRDGIDKHFTAALAVIKSTADNRRDLMASWANFKRRVATGQAAGKFQRVVVTSEDRRPLERLQEQLNHAGVRSTFATRAFRQSDAHDYWAGQNGNVEFPAGSLIIDMAQPQGALAKALLEPGSDFEPEFVKAQREKKKTAPEGETYPGPEGSEFYDTTGWSLVYAHNLKGWWCESAPKVDATPTLPARAASAKVAPAQIGYALPYSDLQDALAAFEVASAGVRGVVTTREMKVGDRTFARGTFLFLNERNDENYRDTLDRVARERGVTFVPLSSAYPEMGRTGPGSESVRPLRKPEIGVVFGRGADMSAVGSTWYLMERVFRLPFTPLSTDALNGDLSKYTCIVVPGGSNAPTSGKFKEWVSAGGTVVSLDGAWGVGSSAFVELDRSKEEIQSLPGALFRAQLDPRSFLSYGYAAPASGKAEIAVPVAGDRYFLTRKAGGSVVTLDADPKTTKLLSGWTYEESEKGIANTVWLQDAPVGRGRAILFFQDPTERAMWPGLYKMLVNSMLFS